MNKDGEVPMCLVACTPSLNNMSKVMSGLPPEIDGERYTKVKSFLLWSFKLDVVPSLRKSGCPDKSCSADETANINEFHAIWALMARAEPYALEMPPFCRHHQSGNCLHIGTKA
ncbi:hypothetical protein E2562_003672 [Oryza meyeriana var. granulata]|uniref:Uncharacterized protein n=1 Tax=Oryza meyeriana var. granulata TaxID=110450 RepID=A0A6G1C2V1_9ORYZ|nr:hypothetical protein E2562_003672 [Oryza meyeriana var. granulata]